MLHLPDHLYRLFWMIILELVAYHSSTLLFMTDTPIRDITCLLFNSISFCKAYEPDSIYLSHSGIIQYRSNYTLVLCRVFWILCLLLKSSLSSVLNAEIGLCPSGPFGLSLFNLHPSQKNDLTLWVVSRTEIGQRLCLWSHVRLHVCPMLDTKTREYKVSIAASAFRG